jgi:hypothetical protein
VYLIKSSSRRYVALNFFLFSLRALVLILFRPNPDSLTGTDPPLTRRPLRPRRCLSVAIPLGFTHLSSPRSPPSLSQDDAFTLWQNNITKLTGRIAKTVGEQTYSQTRGSQNGGGAPCQGPILAEWLPLSSWLSTAT